MPYPTLLIERAQELQRRPFAEDFSEGEVVMLLDDIKKCIELINNSHFLMGFRAQREAILTNLEELQDYYVEFRQHLGVPEVNIHDADW